MNPTKKQRAKPKPDDKAQSKRSIQTIKEVGADNSRRNAYRRITTLLGDLRKAGSLGWDMVLDLTRELVEWATFASPREARAQLRRQYDEDRWLGQPYYPIFDRREGYDGAGVPTDGERLANTVRVVARLRLADAAA